jgi:plasmid stabilization system protein ParE
MSRRRVIVSPIAERWFLNQMAYLLEVNPEAANNLAKRFREFRSNLGQFSGMGVHGDTLGTRRVVMKPYVVIVRLKGDAIEIVAIRHGRQGDARSPDEAKS